MKSLGLEGVHGEIPRCTTLKSIWDEENTHEQNVCWEAPGIFTGLPLRFSDFMWCIRTSFDL